MIPIFRRQFFWRYAMTSSSYWVSQSPEIRPSWRVEMPARELPPSTGVCYSPHNEGAPSVVQSIFRELQDIVDWVIMLPIPEGDGIRFIVGRNSPLPEGTNGDEVAVDITTVLLSHYAVPKWWQFWRK